MNYNKSAKSLTFRRGSEVSQGTSECILAFSGTDDTPDWLTTNFQPGTSERCGKEMHAGFGSELASITGDSDFNDFQEDLQKCCCVFVTGHSLGGALAAIFHYCARAVTIGSLSVEGSCCHTSICGISCFIHSTLFVWFSVSLCACMAQGSPVVPFCSFFWVSLSTQSQKLQ